MFRIIGLCATSEHLRTSVKKLISQGDREHEKGLLEEANKVHLIISAT